jgi:hypothetical protein
MPMTTKRSAALSVNSQIDMSRYCDDSSSGSARTTAVRGEVSDCVKNRKPSSSASDAPALTRWTRSPRAGVPVTWATVAMTT